MSSFLERVWGWWDNLGWTPWSTALENQGIYTNKENQNNGGNEGGSNRKTDAGAAGGTGGEARDQNYSGGDQYKPNIDDIRRASSFGLNSINKTYGDDTVGNILYPYLGDNYIHVGVDGKTLYIRYNGIDYYLTKAGSVNDWRSRLGLPSGSNYLGNKPTIDDIHHSTDAELDWYNKHYGEDTVGNILFSNGYNDIYVGIDGKTLYIRYNGIDYWFTAAVQLGGRVHSGGDQPLLPANLPAGKDPNSFNSNNLLKYQIKSSNGSINNDGTSVVETGVGDQNNSGGDQPSSPSISLNDYAAKNSSGLNAYGSLNSDALGSYPYFNIGDNSILKHIPQEPPPMVEANICNKPVEATVGSGSSTLDYIGGAVRALDPGFNYKELNLYSQSFQNGYNLVNSLGGLAAPSAKMLGNYGSFALDGMKPPGSGNLALAGSNGTISVTTPGVLSFGSTSVTNADIAKSGETFSVELNRLFASTEGEGRGTLKGSLDGLKPHERTAIEDLRNQGKNVEIIPKGKDKTPDFYINGVKTELKTLKPTGGEPNLNTGITRIQEGFKQYSETVILDGRNVGLTKEQAQKIINRTVGSYSKSGGVPGKIEIWTIEGSVTYP